jgi:hypothetical protein
VFIFVTEDGSRRINSHNVGQIQRTLESPRNLEDRQKIFAKIEEEEQRRVLEKPRLLSAGIHLSSSTVRPGRVLGPVAGIAPPNHLPSSSKGPVILNVNVHDPRNRYSSTREVHISDRRLGNGSVFSGANMSGIVVRGGEDPDPEVRHKRDFIKLVSFSFLYILLLLQADLQGVTRG